MHSSETFLFFLIIYFGVVSISAHQCFIVYFNGPLLIDIWIVNSPKYNDFGYI